MRWNFCLETLSSVAQLHSPSILNESNQTNYSDGMRLCVCVSLVLNVLHLHGFRALVDIDFKMLQHNSIGITLARFVMRLANRIRNLDTCRSRYIA